MCILESFGLSKCVDTNVSKSDKIWVCIIVYKYYYRGSIAVSETSHTTVSSTMTLSDLLIKTILQVYLFTEEGYPYD